MLISEIDTNSQSYISLDINEQSDEILSVAHALASSVRLNIIKALCYRNMNVNELADHLRIPVSTISLNVSVLERVGMIDTQAQPGVRGTMRLCSHRLEHVCINLLAASSPRHYSGSIEMPLGCYSFARNIMPSCGLASAERIIECRDSSLAFYSPARIGAQIVWFQRGTLEYMMPTLQLRNGVLRAIEISFEASAFSPAFSSPLANVDAELMLELNGTPIGRACLCFSNDKAQAVANPGWWNNELVQSGTLLSWRVDDTGCYVGNERCSDVTIHQLRLTDGDCFTLCLSAYDSAKLDGGICLFGREFGHTFQDIMLKYALD